MRRMRLARIRMRARADSRCCQSTEALLFRLLNKFMGNDAKLVVAHHLNRALILRQGIVEGPVTT